MKQRVLAALRWLIPWRPSPAAAPVWQSLRVIGPRWPLDPLVATETLRALHGMQGTVVLEIAASAEGVEVAAICDERQAPQVERAFRGSAPEWAIEMVASPMSIGNPRAALLLTGTLRSATRSACLPVRDVRAFGDTDPLSALLEAVQPLGEGERLLIRYRVRPASQAWRAKVRHELTRPAPAESSSGLLAVLMGNVPRVPRFAPQLQRRLEERLAEPAFEVTGGVALTGSDVARLASRGRSLTAAFATQFDCGFGDIRVGSWRWRAGSQAAAAVRYPKAESLYLTAAELAALWHPCSSRVLVSGVSYLRRLTAPLPIQAARAQGLLLGMHPERGTKLPVRLPRPDLDAGHLSVIGRTGVGKSTLIHQLLRQLAAEPDRPGAGVIDPNNDLVRDIALCSIPRSRERDVVLFEMGDTEFPVGLPLFWAPPGVPREALVQTTFAALRLIFREHWSPTRMEDAVFALTATLCRLPQASLLDAPRLFGDPGFRRRATTTLDDPAALEFWADYEILSDAGRRELARPVLYRLRSFYRSPAVRNIVCQTSGVDFVRLMEHGSLLLVSLAGPAIQAEADLLGELIIARLHLAALTRLARPRAERRQFYLAVDESQRFRGASLPILLSEGRKLGLTLILSTQYLDAWGETLAQSVVGNVGTLVAFRCGPADSRLLSASLKPLTPDQLEDLDRFEAVAKLQVGGNTMPAFDFTTMPIDTAPAEARLSNIRRRTRQLYARPRNEVEGELAARNGDRPQIERGYDVDEE